MSEQTGKTVSFWASPENAARLEHARNVKLNVSKIVNGVLDKHLRPAIEKAKREEIAHFQEALESPVP